MRTSTLSSAALRLQDRLGLFKGRHLLGICTFLAGTREAALHDLQVGEHTFGVKSLEIGDRNGEGITLGNLGIAYAELNDARRAIGYFEQALSIYREIGNRLGEENALGNLGGAHLDLGAAARQSAAAWPTRTLPTAQQW